ncbi:unnamed protein product [Mytilus coruscus]|uniref:BRICHOS domain-containing protein n=1 Tax=Mytilus coruscus TaxID=42192 RepID=A0A6J8B3Q8_MYTCO|nr:unnamed protein product [Mytilus coruscus]
MFLAVLLPVILSCNLVRSNDHIQTFRVNVKVPGGRINEDIAVDPKKNAMTVNVGDVSHLNSSWCQTINLHDFEQNKVAIKNIDEGKCLIIDAKETYLDSVNLLYKIERLHYQHEIKDKIKVRANRITHDEMLKMAGEKIADFCRGYKLYYGRKVANDGMPRTGKKRYVKAACQKACFICFLVEEYVI